MAKEKGVVAEGKSPIEYVFQLPAKVIWELAGVLDPGGGWEDIASLMPDISDVDIDACMRLRTGESPTEGLLRIWGSYGYRVADLYKVFFRLKLVRCMQFLDEFASFQSPVNTAGSRLAELRLTSTAATTPTVFSSSKQPHSSATNSTGLNLNDDVIVAGLQNTPSVTYEDILQVTNNFSPEQILGRGGYGVVYRGVWKHMEVAVKRIQGKQADASVEAQKERVRQSLQELRTMAKYRHDNILNLYGYSMDGPEPCLIYQFMANGSLEERLACKSASSPLTWSQRFSIAHGIACGLHYLHSISNTPIIHGDVKSANILLDRWMQPKLGDFGLSRDILEGDGEGSSIAGGVIASHVKGTLAYLPAEFTHSRVLSTKLDVYSYGVVLLELSTGQRAHCNAREQTNLVDYVRVVESEKGAEGLFEGLGDKKASTGGEDDSSSIFTLLYTTAKKCTQLDRFFRPSFIEILGELSSSCT